MTSAINPFMFIFTCRPGNHPFLKITDEFGGRTEIVLQSLKKNSVRKLVAEILNIDDTGDCTLLANFISRVTNGSKWLFCLFFVSTILWCYACWCAADDLFCPQILSSFDSKLFRCEMKAWFDLLIMDGFGIWRNLRKGMMMYWAM